MPPAPWVDDAGAGALTPTLYVHCRVEARLLALPPALSEIGGWLLGYWTADECHLVVSHATPPGPRGTPFRLRISGRGHRPRFDAAWEASSGHVTFIGDWHTHPGGPAQPSLRDREAVRQLAEREHFGTRRPLIAIIQNPRWRRSQTVRQIRWWLREPDGELAELEAVVFGALPASAAAVPEWPWPRAHGR